MFNPLRVFGTIFSVVKRILLEHVTRLQFNLIQTNVHETVYSLTYECQAAFVFAAVRLGVEL